MAKDYFSDNDKLDLLSTFMSSIVAEILKEKDVDTSKLTEDERQELGVATTREWEEGKTLEDIAGELIEKFGSDEDKADYAEWKKTQ